MKNPVAEAREALSLTQGDLAKAAGTNTRFIQNLESGLLVSIPRSVRDALRKAQDDAGLDWNPMLDEQYTRWVSAERVGHWNWELPAPVQTVWEVSPFVRFRTDVMGSDNRMGFCLLLKLPPATVMRYEQGATQAMPRVIEQALSDTDYQYTVELADYQEEWRSTHAV